MRTARFAAVLAVMLVIGVASMAWGDDGQPLILGRGNTATTATTLDSGGGFNIVGGQANQSPNMLSVDGQANFGGWVRMSTGLTLDNSNGTTISRATFPKGVMCQTVAAPLRNPSDDHSVPMIFTGVVGIHPGIYVAGTQLGHGGLTICLNKRASTKVLVNWIDIDHDIVG